MNDQGMLPDHRGVMEALAALSTRVLPDDDLAPQIGGIFTRFGEVRKTSSLSVNGSRSIFLVTFGDDGAAMRAANATGCPLFGFRAILVELHKSWNMATIPALATEGVQAV